VSLSLESLLGIPLLFSLYFNATKDGIFGGGTFSFSEKMFGDAEFPATLHASRGSFGTKEITVPLKN
jgi:hypothetical protein